MQMLRAAASPAPQNCSISHIHALISRENFGAVKTMRWPHSAASHDCLPPHLLIGRFVWWLAYTFCHLLLVSENIWNVTHSWVAGWLLFPFNPNKYYIQGGSRRNAPPARVKYGNSQKGFFEQTILSSLMCKLFQCQTTRGGLSSSEISSFTAHL